MNKQRKNSRGRPKGSPNKITRDLREMIEGALTDLGGQKFLVAAARDKPAAFLALIGKLLPKDVKVSGEIAHTLETIIARSFEKPADQPGADQPGVQASNRTH